MAEVIKLNKIIYNIKINDYKNPILLDQKLYKEGLIRSDAMAMPNKYIIVAPINNNNIIELNKISAALSVQRAIIAIATYDNDISIKKLIELTSIIGNRGDLHQELLMEEIKHYQNHTYSVTPPSYIHSFSNGLINRLFNETITNLDNRSIEQLAVATDLSGDLNFCNNLPINMIFDKKYNRNISDENKKLPMWAANAINYTQNNPQIDDKRLERYLSAYNKKIKDLEKLI